MSGLKVVKTGKGGPTDDISVDGYVAVTETIILNAPGFAAFVSPGNGSGDPGGRADRLQQVVQNAVSNAVVTTKTNGTAISAANCHVKAVPDVDHAGGGSKASHSVPMPPAALISLTYLDEYIQALLDLWNTGQPDKARKFLYGVMMLTKCR